MADLTTTNTWLAILAVVGLVEFLMRSQTFPAGAILLTGTGVVPSETFTLEEGDVIAIRVSGIGELINPVISV